MKHLLLTLIGICFLMSSASAQIGYQLSLLNNATGEPRANERVTVKVKITDSEGKTVCEETKNETSNDFGVVSMSVGDSDTFTNADWSKLPFFIEATVDGRMLGKSQILTIPVAEHAKHTGSLTQELLCSKKWDFIDPDSNDLFERYEFKKDGTLHWTDWTYKGENHNIQTIYQEDNGIYEIDGNLITIIMDTNYVKARLALYNSRKNTLMLCKGDERFWIFKQI